MISVLLFLYLFSCEINSRNNGTWLVSESVNLKVTKEGVTLINFIIMTSFQPSFFASVYLNASKNQSFATIGRYDLVNEPLSTKV